MSNPRFASRSSKPGRALALVASLGVLGVASPVAAQSVDQRLAALEAASAVYGTDIANLKARVAALETQNAAQQVSIVNLQNTNASLWTVVTQHGAALTAMDGRLGTLEGVWGGVATRSGKNVYLTGVNLNIVNGQGDTETENGAGNLIVGYNEPEDGSNPGNGRVGSHNIVVGDHHHYQSFGGIVAGYGNDLVGEWASIVGGSENVALGTYSSVSGGSSNTAVGVNSSVSGGYQNVAGGERSSVSGGRSCTASGSLSSVTGGFNNVANGSYSSVTGGSENHAGGEYSSVSGGSSRATPGDFDWRGGSLLQGD